MKLVIEPEFLSLESVNLRIKQEICYETLEWLTESKLLGEYNDCNSVKNKIKKLSEVLGKYMVEEIKQINFLFIYNSSKFLTWKMFLKKKYNKKF